ncbi:MAG: sulfite exporter TauE/SafE family protein [Ilumatobacteraceae bacterium]
MSAPAVTPTPGRPTQLSMTRVALVGLAAGLLGGMFGVGGGLLIVPALTIVLGFEHRLAHGTSLAAILPIAGASLVTYATAGNVDWPIALWISVGAILGAVLGTRLLQVVSRRALTIAFVIVMLVTAIRLFIPTEGTERDALTVAAALGMFGVGLLSGTLAGLLGVGGGVIMVPAMIVLLGVPSVIAKGTSVAVIIPTSIMGTLRNLAMKNADVRVGAVVGLAGVASAVAGSLIADTMSDPVSNALFAVLLLVVAARQLATLRADRASLP